MCSRMHPTEQPAMMAMMIRTKMHVHPGVVLGQVGHHASSIFGTREGKGDAHESLTDGIDVALQPLDAPPSRLQAER